MALGSAVCCCGNNRRGKRIRFIFPIYIANWCKLAGDLYMCGGERGGDGYRK